MIDPGTGLTILGSTIGRAKVVEKILGPTSEYIGELRANDSGTPPGLAKPSTLRIISHTQKKSPKRVK